MVNSFDLKIVILGASGVGKTSIIFRYFDHNWNRQYHRCTIGMDLRQITFLHTDHQEYKIEVWDTAGCEKYNSLTPITFRDINAAFLCFDPSSLDSWNKLLYWYTEVKKHKENCHIIICATKKDLIDEREITWNVNKRNVDAFVNEHDALYFEISSKTNENIDDLFYETINKCLNDRDFLEEINIRRHEAINRNALANSERIIIDSNNRAGSCCYFF